MVAESILTSTSGTTGEEVKEKRAEEWSEIVRVYIPQHIPSTSSMTKNLKQSLHYKDFRLLHRSTSTHISSTTSIISLATHIPSGTVQEVTRLSEAAEVMTSSGMEMKEIWEWWSSRRSKGGRGEGGGCGVE